MGRFFVTRPVFAIVVSVLMTIVGALAYFELPVEQYPEMYYIRYHESEEGSESGSLVAPFAGNHGWYWLNIEENPVTIELEVRGYFDSLEEIMRSFQ